MQAQLCNVQVRSKMTQKSLVALNTETQMKGWSREQILQEQTGVKHKIPPILRLCPEGPGTRPGASEVLWHVLRKQLCLGMKKATPASTCVGSSYVSGPRSLPGATDLFLPSMETFTTYEEPCKGPLFSPCYQSSVLLDTTSHTERETNNT